MRPQVMFVVAAILLSQSPHLWAESTVNCASIENAGERLACYDRVAGKPVAPVPPESATMAKAPAFGTKQAGVSPLESLWELIPEARNPKFTLRPYKPIYIMPVVYTSDRNKQPCSQEGASFNCTAQEFDLDDIEAKFAISFKTKLAEDLFNGNFDLWGGYSQTSRWQVYNDELSAPFRETNYEPEVIMTYRTDYDLWGWKAKMLGFGFNHQSNGRNEPISRSWNRIVALAALEKDSWVIGLKPWYRLPEDQEDDNNPQIEDYMGRGEAVINWRTGGNNLALTLRHSLRADENRGSGMFEWTFPIKDYLKGYVQLFSGYGESMIDYNHEQTTIGVGISLVSWQ